MFAKKKAARSCEKGHVLEESWERCPHCEAERAAAESAPAVPAPVRAAEDPDVAPAPPPEMRDPARRPVVVPKPEAPHGLPGGWLVALSGEQSGADFRLKRGRNVLGKGAQCDVAVKDAHASDRHAALEIRESGEAVLEDLGSRHGTFVEGHRLEGRCLLRDGERVRIGGTELRYRSYGS